MHTPEHLIAALSHTAQHAVSIHITYGTPADYAALAGLHYRAAAPATVERVVVARDAQRGIRAGVLVISRPTLNGTWRSIAWPGVFDRGDKRERARRINEQLRTISRVVVDPRYRGRGVGASLVRRYLDAPLTRRTEAVAAMGAVSPFFERAGMRRITPHPNRRDVALTNALRRLGWPDDRAACALRLIADHADTGRHDDDTARALAVWSRSSAATRRLTDKRAVTHAAAAALIAPPLAYAYDRHSSSSFPHTASAAHHGEADDADRRSDAAHR